MLGVLLVIVLELAVLAGIYYVLNYTVQHRSGLNDPEKLRRIWSRSQEIRFQPIFKSMLFSVMVAHGAPAVFITVSSLGLACLGVPDAIFESIESVLGMVVMFVCASIGPIIYRAGGGQRRILNVVVLLSFNMVMIYMLLYPTIQILLKGRYSDSPGLVWFAFFFTPLFLTGLQVPFAMWGASREFEDETSRIYSSNPVPDWVRLNKSVLLASGPLLLVRALALVIHLKLGKKEYLNRIGFWLADIMLYGLGGLAAVISVNRALLAEDFRWQWRSFLTPAIPLGSFDLLAGIVTTFIKSNGHFVTRMFMAVQHLCIYGAVGSLSAYLYLYLAELYSQDQLAEQGITGLEDDLDNEELDQEIGEDMFDSSRV